MKFSLVDVYTAGLFDGEGSVTLQPRKENGHSYFYPRVTVTNTERALLDFLVQEHGGSIQRKGLPIKKSHKQIWSWEARCRIAVSFLRRVLPYMREPEKIRRANVLLQFEHATVDEKRQLAQVFRLATTE